MCLLNEKESVAQHRFCSFRAPRKETKIFGPRIRLPYLQLQSFADDLFVGRMFRVLRLLAGSSSASHSCSSLV
jgi:hypothetical protein